MSLPNANLRIQPHDAEKAHKERVEAVLETFWAIEHKIRAGLPQTTEATQLAYSTAAQLTDTVFREKAREVPLRPPPGHYGSSR